MAAINCPNCGKTLNVADQYAGKKVRCPNCQGVLMVPPLGAVAQPEQAMPRPRPPSAAMPPLPPADDPYVAPRPGQRRPDYDDPRRRPPRDDDYPPDPRMMRRRRGPEWAPCPSCGCEDATKIGWTFWGGWIGPAIINCVRCHRCGTTYNGVHGDYNGGRIAIYVVVSIVIGLIVGGVIVAISIANS
ncbi:MAG TPA: hypothetical protein VMS17_28035 [Gemmataceae bacterium]|nr:hypothetical protein [Gemmataceae bacterium]